ncbi:hypothetical protein VTI74DRAFT_4723 [Chaetomium olivicolor]
MSSISNIQLQLWVLGLIRATEAVAWSSIFPYAYYMVQSFNVPELDIAFYAGSLVAVFTFGEFLTGFVWARVSDRVGRKPTLMLGIACALASALSFGLSKSVGVAIATRAFWGMSNPNVGLVPTCTGELASKEQQANAFSLVTFIRSLGNLVGPVLGGLLADPVSSYPSVFSSSSIWARHRYLLPNVAVGLLQVLTLLLTLFFLRETHPQLATRHDPGRSFIQLFRRRLGSPDATQEPAYTPIARDSVFAEPRESTVEMHQLEDLEEQTLETQREPTRAFTLQVVLQILSLSLLAFHKMSADAIMGTFLALRPPSSGHSNDRRSLSFPHANGGFGFDTRTIGIIFLTEAIFRAAIQPTFIPWLITRLGSLGAYRWVLGLYPATYLLTPFLPRLPSPVGAVALFLDLWVKIALSSVGYVCSSML